MPSDAMPSEAPQRPAGPDTTGASARRLSAPTSDRRALRLGAHGARWLGLALALSLASCDNPTCAFTSTGCFGSQTPGALGGVSSLPTEGGLVLPGLPQLVSATPNGQLANSETPIILTFSESLAPQDVANAFSLTSTTDFGEQPVPFSATGFAGGQVIVLLPATPLPFAQDVRLNYVGAPELVDLTGQSLELNPGALVASFSVASVDTVAPQLVATYPPDNATGLAPNSSYLAFFDRPMDASTFGDDSWVVQVEGVDPTFDPEPVALEVQAGPFPVQDTRVWRWTSTDGNGDTTSLGLNVEVSLTLSPSTDPLTDTAGEPLETAEFSFRTASFGAPFDARITSTPDDAIGISGLTPGEDDDLTLAVGLEGAQAGDILDIYIYGSDPGDETSLVSVLRQRELTATDDLLDLELGLDDLELTTSTDPLTAIFADGDVTFAFGLRRGSDVSVLHLLDIAIEDGLQSPVLDTLAPTLIDLAAPGGGGDLFASDLRDLVVKGFASEGLRSVEVSTALGDNGDLPPVVGSAADGTFIAAPVPLGVLEPGQQDLAYTVTLYDRALNPAEFQIVGSFRQYGAAAGGALVADGTVEIEVYDATTLAPIQNATVLSHGDPGDDTTYPLLGVPALTDEFGVATVPTHDTGAGQVGTLVTVVADGYDLFTFHGATAGRLSIPLTFTSEGPGFSAGTVTSDSTLAQLIVPAGGLELADTRRPFGVLPTFNAQACSSNPLIGLPLACPFGPEILRVGRFGAQTLIAGSFSQLEENFSPTELLRAIEFQVPVLPVQEGETLFDDVSITSLVSEPDFPAEDLPVALGVLAADLGLATGIDATALVDDGAFLGAPEVWMDARLPGLDAPALIGLGLAYVDDVNPEVFTVRTAYGGTFPEYLADFGSPEALVSVAFEVTDTDGDRSRVRVRLDQLSAFANTLFAPPVPDVLAPAPAANLGGPEFSVTLDNSLLDGVFASGDNGVYRVTVRDANGRAWVVLRTDQPDVQAQVNLHLPDLAGETGLASGALSIDAEALAWDGFDATSFSFSDLPLLNVFSASKGTISVTLP
jgi:hypothetical protein